MENNIDVITARLQDGISRFRQSDQYRSYLRTMSHFTAYSFNNSLLIWMQRPEATYVAGYKAWMELNRNVRRGEKGIRIYAPIKKKQAESGQEELIRYRAIHVFDISQTVGESLPALSHPLLTDKVEHYETMIHVLQSIAPSPIEFTSLHEQAHGYYSPQRNLIVIDSGMPQLQTMKTLLHEIAHATIHGPSAPPKNQALMEIEAESIAYTVLSYFGFNSETYSFPYIAGWSMTADPEELRRTITGITSASDLLISRISRCLLTTGLPALSPAAEPE